MSSHLRSRSLFDRCQNWREMLLNSGRKHHYLAKEDAPAES
jgi:hypothetical protein